MSVRRDRRAEGTLLPGATSRAAETYEVEDFSLIGERLRAAIAADDKGFTPSSSASGTSKQQPSARAGVALADS